MSWLRFGLSRRVADRADIDWPGYSATHLPERFAIIGVERGRTIRGYRMTAEENVGRILQTATDVIGNEPAAREWMDKRSGTLGGTPRELARSDEGAERVLLHLAGISRHRVG